MADVLIDYDRILNILQASYPQKFDQVSLHRDMIGYVFIVLSESNKYALKIYRAINSGQAMQSIGIINYLQTNGYPVAAIVPTVEGKYHINVRMAEGECIGVLYNFIDGTEPDITADIEKIGQQVGRLHALMAEYPGELVRHKKPFFIDRFIGLLWEKNYPDSRIADLDEYGHELWQAMERLPAGFCHGDLHSGNMIIVPSRDYVLIDFDVASRSYSVIDIATLCDQTDFNAFSTEAYDRTKDAIKRFCVGYKRELEISDSNLNAAFDFIAIRHYELIATIVACQGIGCISTAFLDQQYDWLMSWKALCASKSGL